MAWGGYSNGSIPTTAMVYLLGGWARPDFAVRLVQALAEIRDTFGIDIGFNELYRDFAGQVYWRAWWSDRGKPGNAAVPGYSNHGWAVAGDMDYHEWNDHYDGVVAIFAKYGIILDVPGEDWHIHDVNDWNGFTPVDFQLATLAITAITPITLIPEGDEMPLVYANTDTNVWAIGMPGRWDGIPVGQGEAYVKFCNQGADPIRVDNATWEAARAYFLGGRQLDYGVYADQSTNVWYVLGPGLVYPIPGGQGDLWQTLYGPRKVVDADTLQKMIAGFEKMAPRTDVEGIAKAIAALV